MSRKQLSMRKIGEVARLKASGLSVRRIARSCNVARSTVAEYLERLAASGLSWPLPPELTEGQLEDRLFRQTNLRDLQGGRIVVDDQNFHDSLLPAGMAVEYPFWMAWPNLSTASRAAPAAPESCAFAASSNTLAASVNEG